MYGTSLYLSCFLLISLINIHVSFKCDKDGLFEDENDCRMYYECLWIGTQFERIDHVRCADSLIYNPDKHRCEEPSELETQFSNGIQTQEDLVQFIRFRNCVNPEEAVASTSLPIASTTETAVTTTTTTTTVGTPVTTIKQTTELPTEVIILNEDGTAIALNETNAKVTSGNRTNGEAVVVVERDANQTIAFNVTRPGLFVNIKASKISMNITGDDLIRNINSSIPNVKSKKIVDNDDSSVYMDEKMFFGKKFVMDSTKPASSGDKNLTGRDAAHSGERIISELERQKQNSAEAKDVASTHMSIMKVFIRRRVVKTTTASGTGQDVAKVYTQEPVTLQTAPVRREVNDTDFIRRAKNRPKANHFPINAFRKRKILSIDDSTEIPEIVPTTLKVVDSIEQRLTKSGKPVDNSLTKKRIQEINANINNKTHPTSSNGNVKKIKVKLTMDQQLSPNEKNLTFINFLRVNNINDSYFNQTMVGRKPLKFIKMLKKPNVSQESNVETKIDEQENFHTFKPIFIKPNQTQPFVTVYPKQRKNTKKVILSEFESLIDVSNNNSNSGGGKTSKKMRVFHLKPLQFNTTMNNYTQYGSSTDSSTTSAMPHRKYHYLYKNLKGRLSNETSKKKFESFVIERNNVTRISEVERGGQFQRMFLQPADSLIECKDNDFGLECSCSITLSPPKCKQLINSFLSSCRIVGCQNNGRCINMAYKYPIPYVCSCPSTHMGTYCEIQREVQPQFDFEYYYKPKSAAPIPQAQPQPGPKVGINDFKEPICLPNPCVNHGVCEIIAESIKCHCKNSSYTGKYCEIVLQDRVTTAAPVTYRPRPKVNTEAPQEHHWNCPSDCNRDRNQGRCVLSMLGYPKCACTSGWTGIDCSQRNYCVFNDCLNNATCSNLPLVKSYICLCAKGYSGKRCEVMSTNYFQQQQVVPYNYPTNNPCGSVQCLNNGTCLMSFSREMNQFSFVCKCTPGYRGVLCEIKISRCDHMSCSLKEDPLLQGRRKQKAENATIETTVTAILTDILVTSTSTTTQATPILKEISSTANNPCRNDADLCQKYPYGNNSFVCIRSLKSDDYSLCLPTDSVNCKDSNPCLNGGTCVTRKINNDTKTTWKCACDAAYTGSLCETKLCTDIHKTIKNHTMCQENSVYFKNGGLDSIDIELVLDMHNSLRRQVIPSASNMQKMYWDLRLQQLAQKRAQLCTVDAADVSTRQLPGYGVVIGENIAAGYDTWAHVLSSWISESKYFVYGSDNLNDNIKAGHYTQMIYSGASRIGCGYAHCAGATYTRHYVCYYAEMQTYQSRYQPFTSGNACESCPNNCNEGLCDCKGVYCANGGTLDSNTCTCSCPPSAFTGEFCENIICPKEDSPFCSQDLFKDKCWLYPVVRASCPYMCRLCSKEEEGGAAAGSNSTTTNGTTRKQESTKILRL